jgi:NADPH2:quinone reductase
LLAQKGSLFLTRPILFHYIPDRSSLESRAGDVLGWIREGSLSLHLDRSFPLAQASDAHRALAARETTGKVLIVP